MTWPMSRSPLPPAFADYARFLQHEVPADQRAPEGLQELLGSTLLWGSPERGLTLSLSHYDVGEPLWVESPAVLQEMWAGPPPPPAPNTWGLGANLVVTVYLTQWRPEGERFAMVDVSQVELGFACLPLVTSSGSFLLGPHELRRPVRSVMDGIEAELRRAVDALLARIDAAPVSDLFAFEELLPELMGEPERFESLVTS